jgi:HlyD family secretion protein
MTTKSKITAAGLIALVILAIAAYEWLMPGVTVSAARARTGEIRQYIEERGVTRLPHVHRITMPLAGRVESIDLVEGERVSKGQVVARLVPGDSQLTVEVAQAAVDRLEASIRENQDSSVEATVEKQSIELDESTQRIVEAANEQIKAAVAKEKFAKRHFDRLTEIRKKNAGNVTLDEMDKASLALIESRVSVVQNKLLYRAAQSMQVMTAMLPTVVRQFIKRKDLSSAVLTKQRDEAKARLQQAIRDQERGEMTSPVDGVVLSRRITNERYLPSGEVLLEIGRLEELEVEVDVLSVEVVDVREGSPVEIYGPAIGAEPLKATVKRIYPTGFTKISSLGVEQQRVKVILRLDSADVQRMVGDKGSRRLGVDYRVGVRLITAQKPTAIIVPRSAVFRAADGSWQTFVIRGRTAQLQPIKLGITNDRHVEVTEGVTAEDIVIVAPETDLEDGTKVKPVFQE